MKYMMIVKLTGDSESRRNYDNGAPPDEELMAAIEKLRQRSTASGTMVDTGGLFPDARGARIKAAKGKLTVTDGPFTESKEVIGGYAILQVKSKKEALKIGEKFMQIHLDILGPSFEAEMEVREMAEHQPS
jgi:hypothetical protein